MEILTNKKYNMFLRVYVFILSAIVSVVPVIIAAITDTTVWSAILIGPCVLQVFVVAIPLINVLTSYYNAHTKRGLIHESDIYKLFEEDGTAKLHVGDIDTLPRYNVEIPETKWRMVPVKAFWIDDQDTWMETGEMTTKFLPECDNCGAQFGRAVLENDNWNTCPCCGSRITGVLVPKNEDILSNTSEGEQSGYE